MLFEMPRGTHLSAEERRLILRLHGNGVRPVEIADDIGRSPKAVRNVLSRPEATGPMPRSGRPPKLSPVARRHLLREAKKQDQNAVQLNVRLELPISLSRTRAILSKDPHLKFKRMKRVPKLTPVHSERRVQWARAHATDTPELWRKTIWSDEKKFNLDGPDGFAYYWHDLRKEERYFSKRQGGGGSVMVWGAFSGSGCSTLAFIEGRQNAEAYCETLHEYLLSFAYAHHDEDFRFQHDGASIHTAHLTRDWLASLNIDVLQWPSISPDLNPIENLWGILVRDVYRDLRQFQTKQELREAIVASWEAIATETLSKLHGSMPKRCLDVVARHGRKIDY